MTQDVQSIVAQIAKVRARERNLPFQRRVEVKEDLSDDFKVDRYTVEVSIAYATSGQPFEMIDRVLNACEEFDQRIYEERARHITAAKSIIMKQTAYLERTLNDEAFQHFFEDLLGLNGSKLDG